MYRNFIFHNLFFYWFSSNLIEPKITTLFIFCVGFFKYTYSKNKLFILRSYSLNYILLLLPERACLMYNVIHKYIHKKSSNTTEKIADCTIYISFKLGRLSKFKKS